jgi:hypothetical protein
VADLRRNTDSKGGGLDTILNILKTAWQNKDIIYAIFNIAYLLKRNYLNWIDDYLKKNKPRVVIILVVNYSTTGDYWCIGDEINGLKFLADEIYRELSKKYPIFIFDQSLFVTFEDLEKRADCYITSEKNNKFNRYRLFKIFDSFSGKRNMQYHFSITNFFAVKRTENELNRSGSSWIGSNSKYYYLFFSSRILSDYLKKKEAVKDSVEIKG